MQVGSETGHASSLREGDQACKARPSQAYETDVRKGGVFAPVSGHDKPRQTKQPTKPDGASERRASRRARARLTSFFPEPRSTCEARRATRKPEQRRSESEAVLPTAPAGARMNQAREGGLDGWALPKRRLCFSPARSSAHLQPSHGQGVNAGATVRQCPNGEASSSPASRAAVKSDNTTRKVWLSRSDGRARGKARPSASACGQGQCPGGHGSKVSPVAVTPHRHHRRSGGRT